MPQEISNSASRQHNHRWASAVGNSENTTFRSGTIYAQNREFEPGSFEIAEQICRHLVGDPARCYRKGLTHRQVMSAGARRARHLRPHRATLKFTFSKRCCRWAQGWSAKRKGEGGRAC